MFDVIEWPGNTSAMVTPVVEKFGKKESLDTPDLTIRECSIYHICSFRPRTAPMPAAKLVSFSPQLHFPISGRNDEIRSLVDEVLPLAHIVKLTEEELYFLTGTSDIDIGTKSICDQYQTNLLVLRRKEGGCALRYNDQLLQVAGGQEPQVYWGHPDFFLGGLLYQILERDCDMKDLTVNDLCSMANFALNVELCNH